MSFARDGERRSKVIKICGSLWIFWSNHMCAHLEKFAQIAPSPIQVRLVARRPPNGRHGRAISLHHRDSTCSPLPPRVPWLSVETRDDHAPCSRHRRLQIWHGLHEPSVHFCASAGCSKHRRLQIWHGLHEPSVHFCASAGCSKHRRLQIWHGLHEPSVHLCAS